MISGLSPPRWVADVAGVLTSCFPVTRGFGGARGALDVWAGEEGVLGKKEGEESIASQGLGILGYCIIAQEQKEGLPGQQDNLLLAPGVVTFLH